MVMPRILITGANRGIGLALTLRFAQAGWQVDACCRAPEPAHEVVLHRQKVQTHGRQRMLVVGASSRQRSSRML